VIAFDAWWLPDGEAHLIEQMTATNCRMRGRLTYQFVKYQHVLPHVRARRTAIDVGAHAGLWSYWMALDFDRLAAFEPVPDHRACWHANVPTRPLVQLYPYALGDELALVQCVTLDAASSGDTFVLRVDLQDAHEADARIAEQRTLDSFALTDVDFLKIDCQGYEVFVLEGARDLLRRCRPVVLVEQKPGFATRYGRVDTAAVDLLLDLGAHVAWMAGGDYCLVFPEA